MVRLNLLGALALSAVVPASASIKEWIGDIYGSRPITLTGADIQRELGPLISSNSSIYANNDDRFAAATSRWQMYRKPDVQLVVEPGVEADVPEIVKFANHYNIPFLAVNTGHGSSATLGRFKGIQIALSNFRQIEINEKTQTAMVGGGVYGQQIMDTLWEAGYVTVTGSCGCVGLMGPALGGGHGRLQGKHGMMSDNFVKLNVVLADGTTVEASETSNPDLFWAMKGAGHNFGIVTSAEIMIHPRGPDTWHSSIYTFTPDKLEEFTVLVNNLGGNGTQPDEIIHWTLYQIDPRFSTKPIIHWSFEFIGSEAEAQPYLEPFNKLGPIDVARANVPYPDMPKTEGTSEWDPICWDKTNQHMQWDAGLQNYDVATQREIFDLFTENVVKHDELKYSFIVMEGYSVGGVMRAPRDASAYALRDDYLLVAINVQYAPTPAIDDEWVKTWGLKTRDLWNGAQSHRQKTSYVNYAYGKEPNTEVYGYESWRQEKLGALKAKYDPKGRFSYFVPIVAEGSADVKDEL